MNRIYKDALEYWGVDAQRWALIEEMGEVMQALSHEKRGRGKWGDVCNELIDLQTTINMLRPHYISDVEWERKLLKAESRIRQKITEALRMP